jgi:hypothetical protein
MNSIMVEKAVRIVEWINTRRIGPTAEDVMAHFGVSRATAYRWLNGYCDAHGIARIRIGTHCNDRYAPVEAPTRRRPVPVWAGESALRSAVA